jgi:hypothetical protein
MGNLTSLNNGVPAALTEIITPGRTLNRRSADVQASFDRPGTSNGPTEAINGRLEHPRGSAPEFRNLTNHIPRSLLKTGGPTPTTPRIVKSRHRPDGGRTDQPDPFAVVGPQVLRGGGLRVGGLLDLEGVAILDFGPSGARRRVPVGKADPAGAASRTNRTGRTTPTPPTWPAGSSMQALMTLPGYVSSEMAVRHADLAPATSNTEHPTPSPG